MSHWSFAVSFSVVVAGLAIWLGALWLSYANWHRRGRTKTAGALEILRWVIISLLVFTLWRPEFIRLIDRSESPEILILTDASGSMETADVTLGDEIITRADWLEHQRGQEFWKPLENTAQIRFEEFSAPGASSPNDLDGTDLDQALETILKRQKNLKAVLLLTDGDWNMGRSPVGTSTRFREQEIPIFAVAVGRDSPMPDLVLERVSAPSYGLLGEQISIPFKIQSHLPREVKTSLALTVAGREEIKKELIIPPLGQLQDSLIWFPRAAGEYTLELDLPVEPDEILDQNNRQEIRISVRSETLKVLVVDSLPRWEYRFLRNALDRDPGIELHCLLFHPGMAPGGGRTYISSFPSTKELLSRYDVIFLGDVGIGENELTENEAELLKGLIEQQSSGLVFLPGRRGRQATFLDSPLKDLLPVVLESERQDGIGLQNESLLLLTANGKGHLLTQFDSDGNRNDEIWRHLPGFYWSAAVEKSRPGSEVLAVHSSLRNSWGRIPLLVTRPYGSGKVLFMGTDSAWRWRRGVEDKFHYRFWGQVVRWMAHQRHLSEKDGVRLVYSPETPRVGETVFLQTTLLDDNGFPIEKGPVTGRITSPEGRLERLEFTPIEGGWGVFKSSFTPQSGGTYQVTVASDRHNRSLDTDIPVIQPVREQIGQPANPQILREIAGITRGSFGATEDLPQVVQQISLLPEPKPIEQRVRLWANPWWGALLIFLLGIYWTGRKMAGMI
jgi:uncharacterized membrane protein